MATLTLSFLPSSTDSSSIRYDLPRIGQGDLECFVLRLQRHEMVPEHQVHRHRAKQFVVDLGGLQIHELAAIALRDRQRLFGLGSRILYFEVSVAIIGIVSASEKMGRYSATSTNATKMPMKIMIAGSMKRKQRGHSGRDILFVEFRHAAQHLRQRAGRFAHLHHVDRERGNNPVVVSDAESVLPSRTSTRTLYRATSSAEPFRATGPYVSSACTSGIPPISSVPRTRDNCAT